MAQAVEVSVHIDSDQVGTSLVVVTGQGVDTTQVLGTSVVAEQSDGLEVETSRVLQLSYWLVIAMVEVWQTVVSE